MIWWYGFYVHKELKLKFNESISVTSDLWRFLNLGSRPEMFCKKGVLTNFVKFTAKHLCQSLFLIKLHASTEVFSWEICKTFEITYYQEHLRTAVSTNNKLLFFIRNNSNSNSHKAFYIVLYTYYHNGS